MNLLTTVSMIFLSFAVIFSSIFSSIATIQIGKKLTRIEAQLKDNHPCD